MLSSIRKNFKFDFPAGVVVWLVALPLCLGIAQVSGAPPFTGIISGIIGGIVVTAFSGSKFGVSGPSAALPIVLGNAIFLMGFETFLVSVIIAGVLQLFAGYLRLGFLGYFIPTAVINGMMASIGIVLVLKQIPHALGVDTDAIGDFSFFQNDGQNTFSEIFYSFEHITLGSAILSIVSIIIMVIWGGKKIQTIKFFKLFPSSLFVVILGVIVNYIWEANESPLFLESQHLVPLPEELFTLEYSNLLTTPKFSAILSYDVWIQGVTIAFVCSVETLLSLEATDKIDPDKNISPTNKELKAQGIGNLLAGFLGGLPITQVVVRSSANINANARTQWSIVYHGILLTISVFVFPILLSQIPLASLSAVLIVIGYKLVSIKSIAKSFKNDRESFVPLIVTILAVLFTNLITGIGIGFVVAMFYILRQNYELAFISSVGEDRTIISFAQIVSFLNKGGIMQTLQEIPDNTKVVISAKKTHTMSNEIVDLIRDFKEITSKRHNIDLQLIGFDKFGIEDQAGTDFSDNKDENDD